MQIKTLHIIPTYYPATVFGGPIYSVHALNTALGLGGNVRVDVLTTDSSGWASRDRLELDSRTRDFGGHYRVYYSRKTLGKEFSLEMLGLMSSRVREANILHITGVYSVQTLFGLLFAKLYQKPVVWSPRGSLQRWSGSAKPFVKALWELLCKLITPRKCALHVTSEAEARESKGRVICSRIAVIPNGVEIPDVLPKREWRPGDVTRLMFIGRIDPKKGLENLLDAMAAFVKGVELRIYGSGDSAYQKALEKRIQKTHVSDRVHFLGHVIDEAKAQAFRSADICVIPSHTENFGMVIAEALAHGVPVIASTGTPWKEIKIKECGDWVNNDPATLVKTIQSMESKDLQAMGARGRKWMQQEYSWLSVAKRMETLYHELLTPDV